MFIDALLFALGLVVIVSVPLVVLAFSWPRKQQLTIRAAMAWIVGFAVCLGIVAQAEYAPSIVLVPAGLGLYALPYFLIALYVPARLDTILIWVWMVILTVSLTLPAFFVA